MRSKSNVGLFLLYLLAAALVVYSVSLVILSNFNMGNLMVWLLTACVVGYAVFRRTLLGRHCVCVCQRLHEPAYRE